MRFLNAVQNTLELISERPGDRFAALCSFTHAARPADVGCIRL